MQLVIWLLSSKAGLWAFFYRQLRQDIDSDLSLMSRKVEKEQNLPFKLMNDPQWKTIFMNLEGFWEANGYPNQPQYQPLAALFESLGDYKIAAFFHHVVSGEVPKKVFTELNQKGFQWEIYDIWVTREVNTLEKTLLLSMELGGRIAPTKVAIGMIVLSLVVGGVLGIYRQKYNLDSPTTTEQGITAMRNDFGATFPDEKNKKVSQAILAVFRSASGNAKLQEQQITQEEEAGVLAIRAYQDKISQFNPELNLKSGIIESGGNTYEFLTCDVADKLLLQLENRPTICRQLNQNTTSIKQLISDLVRELNADGEEVQQAIINILRVYSQDRQLSLGDITQESDRGKEAVKAYQIQVVSSTGSSVDGIISNGQNTFKVLKCHVADTMDIPLPNRPQICDSARL